jgi:hypothetical protein
VEGLVLDDVAPGWYSLTCLPIKIQGAEGAPARCILQDDLVEDYMEEDEKKYEEEEEQEME